MGISYIVKTIGLALLSGGATFIGIYIGLKFKGKRIAFGLSFAAGIMILISVLELLPAAFKAANLFLVLGLGLTGGVFLFLANYFIPHIHSLATTENKEKKKLFKLAYLLAIGLVLHDFPEGFAIPSAFGVSDALGLLVIAATFIHNIPEGYVMACASAECQKNSFCYKSAAYSSLATLGGAILGLLLLNCFAMINPLLLAFAAGAMLYIALHELLPSAKQYRQGLDLYLGFAAAAVVFFSLGWFI